MDQFNKLPFPQKIAVLVGAMVLIAGLFYYAMITPIEDEARRIKQRTATLQGEVTKLKKDTEKFKDIDFKKETEELEAKKARFEELLPPREELPQFITDLSESAKAAGLLLVSFEKGDPQVNHYYVKIPIQMSVLGTFRELIGFLRAVANPERRVVNISNLSIQTTKINIIPILLKYHEQRLTRVPPGASLKELSPAQQFMQRVKAFEEAIASGLDIKASFTSEVFVYTGQKAPQERADQIKGQQEAIKAKRKKRWGMVAQ